MNKQKLRAAISDFSDNKKANTAYYEENWSERKERKGYYQSFTKLIWGNKQYIVDKLIADNGFDTLKKQLSELLYGTSPIEKRWDVFLKAVKGMGPATMSELLTYANPEEFRYT